MTPRLKSMPMYDSSAPLRATDRFQGSFRDRTAALSRFYSHRHHPIHLRRNRFENPEPGKASIFTKPAGKSNCLSGESINTFAPGSVMPPRRTPRNYRNGRQCRHMRQSPPSENVLIRMSLATLCCSGFRSPSSGNHSKQRLIQAHLTQGDTKSLTNRIHPTTKKDGSEIIRLMN